MEYVILGILIVIVVLLIIILLRKNINKESEEKINRLEGFSYSMIIGGILGNLFDRIVYGYVIDFADIKTSNIPASQQFLQLFPRI